MNKYVIGIIMLFLIFVVFTSANLIIGDDGEPNFVEVSLNDITIDDSIVTEYVEFSQKIGKITFTGIVQNSELDYGINSIEFPLKMYYDIYSTGDDTDVLIYEAQATAVAEKVSNVLNLTFITDVVVTIPYSVEYLLTTVTRGYQSILDNLITEFRQGFPTLPSGDVGIIDYVAYIGRGLFHSVTSVAITFDFIVFPINIMRGTFV